MSEKTLLNAFQADRGLQLDPESVISSMRAAFLANVIQVREIELIADVARRNQHQLPLAVASGGPATIVLASLKAANLLSLFDAIVTSDDVGSAKPEPDLFLEAARRLATKPDACLVFEDSREGLEAARRAGMRAVDVHAILQNPAFSRPKPRRPIMAVYEGGKRR